MDGKPRIGGAEIPDDFASASETLFALVAIGSRNPRVPLKFI